MTSDYKAMAKKVADRQNAEHEKQRRAQQEKKERQIAAKSKFVDERDKYLEGDFQKIKEDIIGQGVDCESVIFNDGNGTPTFKIKLLGHHLDAELNSGKQWVVFHHSIDFGKYGRGGRGDDSKTVYMNDFSAESIDENVRSFLDKVFELETNIGK